MGDVITLACARVESLVDALESVSDRLIAARRTAGDHARERGTLEARLVEGVARSGKRRGQPHTPSGRLSLVMRLNEATKAWTRAFDRREALTLEFARLRALVPAERWGERARYAAEDPWLELDIREARAERNRTLARGEGGR